MDCPQFEPVVTLLPVDKELPDIQLLIDRHWVWQTYCGLLTEEGDPPQRIRLRNFAYQPGVRALVSYTAEQRWDRVLVQDDFAVEMAAGKHTRAFRYPNDPYLPGLQRAASAVEAQQLLSRYASLTPYRLKVDKIRYRPGTRAVLRYTASWRSRRPCQARLFARVMVPARLPRFLSAMNLASKSTFVIPHVVASWEEGGVVWLPEVSGNTVRTLVHTGTPPEPARVLDSLASLWSVGLEPNQGHTLNVAGGFRVAKDILSMLPTLEASHSLLRDISEILEPFVADWHPTTLAHNDFYDDQMFVTPDEQLVLVDYEEIGPGDPMFDVGNMLAHLRWMARFGDATDTCGEYHRRFRSEALSRFGWDEQALATREGFALFRLASDAFRRSGHDWAGTVTNGLLLTLEALGHQD